MLARETSDYEEGCQRSATVNYTPVILDHVTSHWSSIVDVEHGAVEGEIQDKGYDDENINDAFNLGFELLDISIHVPRVSVVVYLEIPDHPYKDLYFDNCI